MSHHNYLGYDGTVDPEPSPELAEGATTRIGFFRCAAMTSPSTFADIEMSTLGNGVRVITEVMPHVRSVSVGIWIGSGSRRESTGRTASPLHRAHALQGTTSRSAEDIARSVDALVAIWTPLPPRNWCVSTPRCWINTVQASTFWPTGAAPMFREEDIEKEKGVILEEIKMEEDSPTTWFTRSSPPISGRITHWASRFSARQAACAGSTARCADFYNAVYTPANVL